jgi:hypothetical protein
MTTIINKKEALSMTLGAFFVLYGGVMSERNERIVSHFLGDMEKKRTFAHRTI